MVDKTFAAIVFINPSSRDVLAGLHSFVERASRIKTLAPTYRDEKYQKRANLFVDRPIDRK